LVNKGEELHQLIQMFETKKVASFFNRDSSEYTNAWNAVKNFLDVRNSFRAAYNNYKQGKFASEDAYKAELERLKPQFTAATERLTDNLKIYIASSTKGDKENKVAGNIGVENKTQGAGVSRLVGAKGLLKYLGGEMQTVRSQEQQEADRVHEVTYQNLYKNTMNNLTERHASNKHRTSANVAQDILEERIKEERRHMARACIKSSKQPETPSLLIADARQCVHIGQL
ncbi:MAG: hypothetical protein IJT34_03960, partial [Butyrivibrio sp.]|nr:hypothetical protein [Butyrivibrio sp.]